MVTKIEIVYNVNECRTNERRKYIFLSTEYLSSFFDWTMMMIINIVVIIIIELTLLYIL